MARKRKKKKLKKIVLLLFLLAIIGSVIYFMFFKKMNPIDAIKEKVEPPKLQIVDENSKTRPIAVMINNNHAAWPHAGLQDAYIVYEIIAEGGITRMMAIFKDQDTEKIGSVRSARPYYLDYALENDAIYVHFGWSNDAKSDINSLGVDNINGLTDSSVFWRDTSLNKSTEHTAFTSMEKIKTFAKEKGYDRETNKDLLLDYSIKELNIDQKEGAQRADKILIDYSYYTNTSYEYDSEKKVYKRSMSDTAHTDAITNNQYTTKNIIIAKIKNYSYDSYGRQKLDNIGSGDGYFITNGYAVPITWEKSGRTEQTVYKYSDGKEIKVNDGNTFIQIQPTDKNVTITANEAVNDSTE